jgi:formate dehydrogenase maturation protein FdhE
MNTETLDLITGVVEEIIAAIPQIVVVLTTVVYSLNAIKSKVNTFPVKIEDTKLSLNKSFDETKQNLNTSFAQTKKEMLDVVDNVAKKIQLSVEGTLSSMAGELQGYKQQLQSESDQVNLLVRQNKVFTDIIASLVAKEPAKVNDAVAKIVAQRTTLSKQELENYPSLLIKELPMLEKALKEAYVVLGESKLKELLGKIGYGKED